MMADLHRRTNPHRICCISDFVYDAIRRLFQICMRNRMTELILLERFIISGNIILAPNRTLIRTRIRKRNRMRIRTTIRTRNRTVYM